MNWAGLAAETWDDLGGDSKGQDHDFFLDGIRRSGEPALDAACGSGRLLLRFLKLGYDVDGVDLSEDMLRICRRKAERAQLVPTLYRQAMQDLDLPRRYRVIFSAGGSFGLLDAQEAAQALERFHDHLLPGGLLMISLFSPFAPRKALSGFDGGDWTLIARAPLPDGRVAIHEFRRTGRDDEERVLVEEKRYRVVDRDSIVAEETHVMRERWYEPRDIEDLLSSRGFGSISVTGDFGTSPWSREHAVMSVVARRL